MQTQLPVIRTYTGPDRTSAQEAYRRDAQQARQTGWHPVAHRWRVVDGQQELAVVFQPEDAPIPLTDPSDDTLTRGSPTAAAAVGTPEGLGPAEELATHEALATDHPTPDIAVADDPRIDRPEPAAGSRPEEAADPLAGGATDRTGGPAPAPRSAVAPRGAAWSHARLVIETIDLHAGGEPLRLIRSGYPRVPNAPILERRRWVREHADAIRRVIIDEPRGHRDMYGAVLLPAHDPDADIAVLFLHNEGYSTMCGHGIIALATGLIEEGLYPASAPTTVIRWETPAGIVTSTSDVTIGEDGRAEVTGVRFRNVVGYLHARDLLVPLGAAGRPGVAAVRAQLAFGGAYYGIVDVADLGMRVTVDALPELRSIGAAITARLREDHTPQHPTDADLGFVYGTMLIDRDAVSPAAGLTSGADLRSVTVFADAAVDRSPCGSATSALLAWLHATDQRAIGDGLRNASVTGSVFEGRLEETATIGDRDGVVTSIAGTGYVIGYHTFVADERDPLGDGFLLP